MHKKRILNILSTFTAVILSIIFVVFCVATPFYFSITALSKPKTIVKIIQNVDYKNIIKENKELEDNLKQVGIDGEAADKLMKSPEAAVIIEDYSDEITDILVNIPTDKEFDISLVQQVIDDNIDAVLDIVEDSSQNPIVREDIKSEINNAVKKYKKTIEQSFTVVKQVSISVKTIYSSKIVKNILTPKFAFLFLLIILFLTGIICILKHKKAQCVLWIAIDCIISAAFLAAIIIFNNTDFVSKIALKASDFGSQIVLSTISLLVNRLGIGFLCLSALAAILITVYVIIYLKLLKKSTTQTELQEVISEEKTAEDI